MERSKNIIFNSNFQLIIVVVLFSVGIVINSVPFFYPIVKVATPAFLLFICVLTCFTFYQKNNKKNNHKLLYSALLVYYFSLFIEILGVKTGFLFGNYQYHDVLGPKIFDTPVIMGFVWIIVTYCVVGILQQIKMWNKSLFRSLFEITIGSLLLVCLDILIEPVAIYLNFWTWDTNGLPSVSNYIGWFFVSVVNLGICKFLNVKCHKFKILNTISIMLLVFFLTLNIIFYFR